MTSLVFDTGTGDQYCLLGPALDRKDIWLVRHQASQQLALVQRFANPSPLLVQLLHSQDNQLPTIQDSWMEAGAIYVVMDRISGTGLDELGPSRLTGQGHQQLKRLRLLLQQFGFPVVAPACLCLSSDGVLRLRCFPDPRQQVQPPARTQVASRVSWLRWLSPLFNLFNLLDRPQLA
ncbi:hypothetical protein IV102_31910 [bacterium]|nr:hypothetical protein [bacterium]